MPRRSAPRAKKSLGQHFLRDESVLDAIVEAIGAPPGSSVVEVGPGTGQLTKALLDRGFNVVAIERDARMVGHLRNRFGAVASLTVAEGDARDIEPADLLPPGTEYTLVGNLPYFIASPIVRHFLELPDPPRELVVMVQREVGREMAAADGKRSMLSVGVQTFGACRVAFRRAARSLRATAQGALFRGPDCAARRAARAARVEGQILPSRPRSFSPFPQADTQRTRARRTLRPRRNRTRARGGED